MNSYDSVFDLTIPEKLGRIFNEYKTTDCRARLVIIQEVFSEANSQTSIRDLCALYAKERGINLFVVEGDNGPIEPGPTRSIEQIIASSATSAGVISFINANGKTDSPIVAWGVDDNNLREQSWDMMRKLKALTPLYTKVFNAIRQELDK